MRITKFKSLFTNIDPNDIKLEYLATARNVRLRDMATETKFYESTTVPIPSNLPSTGYTILTYEAIELDNDLYQSEIINNKIVPTYQHNIEKKYLLVVSYRNQVVFFLDESILVSKVVTTSSKATIYKDAGRILILLDNETLWLGKLDRNVWRNGVIQSFNDYYIDRYLEPIDVNNLRTTGTECNYGRRLGLNTTVAIDTNQVNVIKDIPVTFTKLEECNAKTGGQFYHGNPNNSDLPVYVYRCRDTTTAKNPIDSPPSSNPINTDTSIHVFYTQTFLTGTFVCIPKEYFFSDIENVTGNFKLANGDINTYSHDDTYYYIPPSDLILPGFLTYGQTIGNFGFESSLTDYQIVVTSILDNKEEIITEYIKGNIGIITTPRYALKFGITIASNVNSRLTGIGVYIRFSDATDFTQVKTFNLISNDKLDAEYMSFTIGEISTNGIQLLQTIGILFNPNYFQLIHSFDYFMRVNGLSYAVKNNQIYGPVTGNGKLLDLFYPENYIPNITSKTIVAVSDLNDIPAIHDNEKTTLLLASDSGLGKIYYSKRDTVGFVIKNRYDIAWSPDGIAIHTREGIYIYNGNGLTSISKEIDNIIENNFLTGMIFFNQYNKDLYYITSNTFNEFYRYSSVDKNWTTHTLSNNINVNNLQSVSTNHNGDLLLVCNNVIYQLETTDKGAAEIVTQLSDLGRPNEVKSFEEYRIDFIGEIIFNGKRYKTDVRKYLIAPVPMHKQYAKVKTSLSIAMLDNTKIYAIEIIETTIAPVDIQ